MVPQVKVAQYMTIGSNIWTAGDHGLSDFIDTLIITLLN